MQWWFSANHLYEVAIEPVYFGEERRQQLLGFLIVGFEIDDRVTHELSQVAASHVAFYYGDALVRSTLSAEQQRIFSGQGTRVSGASLESPVACGAKAFPDQKTQGTGVCSAGPAVFAILWQSLSKICLRFSFSRAGRRVP